MCARRDVVSRLIPEQGVVVGAGGKSLTGVVADRRPPLVRVITPARPALVTDGDR